MIPGMFVQYMLPLSFDSSAISLSACGSFGSRLKLSICPATCDACRQDNVTCAYWDEDEHRWSIEGVTTLGTSNQELRCATTHLSIFAGVPR